LVEEVGWAEYLDIFVAAEVKEVAVTGDNDVCVA